jgi:hypothetical protein
MDNDLRSRLRRRFVEFVAFALIYLVGSALLDFLKERPWNPDPFVLFAYAAGALIFVLLPHTQKSGDQRA